MAGSGVLGCFPGVDEGEALVVPARSIVEFHGYVARRRGRSDALAVAASIQPDRVIDRDGGLAGETAEVAVSPELCRRTPRCMPWPSRPHEATLCTRHADVE